MDILGLSLFDLMAPLAMKVADVDGHIANEEKACIADYFIDQWGYDSGFVNAGLLYIEERLSDYSISQVATSLAEYKKQNPDCNYDEMTKELSEFLMEIAESNGIIDEREEMAIEKVRQIFSEIGKSSIPDKAKEFLGIQWTVLAIYFRKNNKEISSVGCLSVILLIH